MIKTILRLIIVFTFLTQNIASAQISSAFIGSRGGAEFFVGKEEGKPLITVNFVNGAASPGIYHIPIDTNIAQLISYAGGTQRNSELESVQIRRTKSKDQVEFIEYDYEKLMRAGAALPILMDKDVVNIPISYKLESTAQYVGIFVGIATLLIGIRVLNQ